MLRLLTFGGLSLESSGSAAAPQLKPQRLALLAILAAVGDRGATRERLVGMFWPEADDERGRHSLRQMLYALRQEAGDDLVRAGSSLFLNRDAITSDLSEFHAALAAGDRGRAAALHRGPFLDGFYLSGAPEFERWVEQERSRLGEAAMAALVSLAGEASTAGRHEEAVGWWHRLTQLDPLSARFALNHARTLVALGERPKALAAIQTHEVRVRRELEVDPDPELGRLAASIRAMEAAGSFAHPSAPFPATAPPVPEPGPAATTHPAGRPARWTGRRVAGLVLAGLLALAVGLGTRRVLAGRSGLPGGESAMVRPFTRSAVAARFYEEGLRAHKARDMTAVRRLMRAALQEDSTFAMAAYLAALAGEQPEYESRQRALRLAQAAPERDRLTIQADLLASDMDPSALTVAEEAARKYPDDSGILMALGSARLTSGDWAGAVAAYERVVELDRTSGSGGRERCTACDALGQLAEVYAWWDSLPAVERVARRYLEIAPDDGWPLGLLAGVEARRGDSARALAYLRRFSASTATPLPRNQELTVLLLLERYDQVLATALPLADAPHILERSLGRWMAMIALRSQGRLAAAEAFHRSARLPGARAPAEAPAPDYFNEAILALESGAPRQAAAYFEVLRRSGNHQAAGQRARWITWNTLLQATALAAAGDTGAVRQLVDTVRYWGERSLFGRDRKAGHFLLGLLAAARGDDQAAVREYRAAIHSTSYGYTRVNAELARALLRLGQPEEAVAILQPALRGAVDASNLYITRTELHELLAEAFARAGQADSAAAHDRAVVEAWAQADPRFAGRREVSRRRLAQYLAARP